MALDGSQLALTAEIAREPYADVVTAAALLNTDQESLLSDDLGMWEVIRNSHVKLKGGSDGVDFDNERKRAAIFYRVRNMLGFPFVVYSLDENALQLFELEVGSAFG